MHKAEIWPKGSKGSDQIYNYVGNLKHFYVSLQRSVQCIIYNLLQSLMTSNFNFVDIYLQGVPQNSSHFVVTSLAPTIKIKDIFTMASSCTYEKDA